MAIQIGLDQELVITGGGLDAGSKVELSIMFTAKDGSGGNNAGFSQKTVKPDGSVRFQVAVEEITPESKDGHCKAWFRPAGSPFSADPIGPDAYLEFDLPLQL